MSRHMGPATFHRSGESRWIGDRRRRRVAIALAFALASLGLLTACGGQTGSGATGQPTVAPTRAPTATKAPTTPPPTRARPGAQVPTPEPLTAEEIGPPETTGDAQAGAALFASLPPEALAAGAVTCASCHHVEPGSGTLVGPSLSGVAARAATRDPNLTAAQYLRVSITHPNNYIVEGFTAGAMPSAFKDALTPEQIEDLVAYMLSLP
ncbi:MAG: cytochrome c [Oscillochloridaceae bacterium]|nr:cytochrome c [Chloroflexaceae bacterium]MDW8390395.1 cytochrome c [Oscillochloridaceae bacterium]